MQIARVADLAGSLTRTIGNERPFCDHETWCSRVLAQMELSAISIILTLLPIATQHTRTVLAKEEKTHR